MAYKNQEKTLLILDVDETLIHATQQKLEQKEDFKLFHYYVYKRPYLLEFLKSVKEDFLLAIWSSASDDYVAAIIQKIIPNDIPLEFVWGGSRCTYRRNYRLDEDRFYTHDGNLHYRSFKILKKVKRQGYDINRILIVDDSPHKVQANYGNAIYPEPFTGDPKDTELMLLAKYLKMLKDETKVRQLEKRYWRTQVD